MPVGEFLQSSM